MNATKYSVACLAFLPNLVFASIRPDAVCTYSGLGLPAGFMCYPVWQLFYLALITALGMLLGPAS